MHPADPFAATPEPLVELLRQPRMAELGSAYVQIFIDNASVVPGEGEEMSLDASYEVPERIVIATGSDS
jgi:hypothetical protein